MSGEVMQERPITYVDERFFAPSPAAVRSKLWRADELALLREHYPTGGAKAALAALPGRERKAIYTKARELGLRAPLPAHLPTRLPTKYPPSEAIDAEIRRVYASKPKSGDINALARGLMRPAGWVSRRAAALGVVVPRFKSADWAREELVILEEHAHQSVCYIRKLLAQAGYRRTASAVAVKVNRVGLDRTDPDNWTTGELARLMGVAALTVFRWVTEEELPARRRTPAPHAPYIINRADLRRWIARHAQLVDLRKVERYWFIDLMAGPAAKSPAGGPRKELSTEA